MRKLKHPSRDAISKRLARAIGHLQATLRMIERQKPCVDLVQQLHAVEAAVAAAKRQLIIEQTQVCLDGGNADGATVQQLKALARYL